MRTQTAMRTAAMLGILVLPLAARAGDLNAPAPPNDPRSAMFTLTDLYNRLKYGTTGTRRVGPFAEPLTGPGSTGRTFDEIMGMMPAFDASGANAGHVLGSKTFWGLLSGAWGLQTGTMPDQGTMTFTPGTTSQTIPAGYHNGSGSVLGDSNLLSANIKKATTIFGVTGDSNVVDTSGGNAVASDLLLNKTAYVKGSLVTGSATAGDNVNGELGQLSMVIPDGLYSGNKTATAWDNSLKSTNIKSGVTIFGVPGAAKTDPGCFDNSNRYVDCGNGTVTDTVIGLIWLKNASCLGVLDYASANTSAVILRSGQCGLTDGSQEGDWRLPTVDEWSKMVLNGLDCQMPALLNTPGTGCFVDGPQPFTGVLSTTYWTATSDLDTPSAAWAIDLHYTAEVSLAVTGQSNILSSPKTGPVRVWPVRGVASPQPSYDFLIVRPQVAAGVAAASGAKAAVAEYWSATGMVPANSVEAGFTWTPTLYVSNVTIVNGRVDVLFSSSSHAAIAGKVLSFTPYDSGIGAVVWRCGNSPAPPYPLLGTGSVGPVAVYSPTAIANQFLPASCRP